MNLSNEILFFVSALGTFNGLLLSGYFFVFNKSKSLSSVFLGLLLLALSVRIGKSVVFYFNPKLSKFYLQIGLSACFFIGPFLYFFLKSSLENVKKTPFSWKLHLLFLLAIIVGFGVALPYQSFPNFWYRYFIRFIYAEWAVYMVLAAWLLRGTITQYFQKRDTITPLDSLSLSIFGGTMAVLIAYLMALFNVFWGAYIVGPIIFSFLLYFNILVLMSRSNKINIFEQQPTKYQAKKINDDEVRSLSLKLQEVVNTKEIYSNPELKINDLAQKMNISAHQLSQLLNDNLGKSFPNFINEIRIEKACELMEIDNRLKLEAIGYEVGFNSKSTFFAAFKKIKGTTPLTYKENVVQ